MFVGVSVLRASDYTVFCRAENDVNFLSIWLIDFFLFVPAILHYEPSCVVSIFQKCFSLNCSYVSDIGCMNREWRGKAGEGEGDRQTSLSD